MFRENRQAPEVDRCFLSTFGAFFFSKPFSDLRVRANRDDAGRAAFESRRSLEGIWEFTRCGEGDVRFRGLVSEVA